MVIHDCSTTISCSICSDEFTIEKYLSEKAMRKIAAKSGWRVINGEDVCPKHDAQINATATSKSIYSPPALIKSSTRLNKNEGK